MTPEQEKQFEDFGCVSRCLLTLANAYGAKLTKEAFIDRYASRFWATGEQCGLLPTTVEAREVALDLGLAAEVEQTEDFEKVRRLIRAKALKGLLLFTARKREKDGSLSVYNHCTLVNHATAIDGHFALITSHSETGAQMARVLPDASLVPLIPRFVLLLREIPQERPGS